MLFGKIYKNIVLPVLKMMLGPKRNHGHNGQNCSSCLIGLGSGKFRWGKMGVGNWQREWLADDMHNRYNGMASRCIMI